MEMENKLIKLKDSVYYDTLIKFLLRESTSLNNDTKTQDYTKGILYIIYKLENIKGAENDR